MLHPKIEIALDEIDAAVINGDTFHDPDERAKLLGFVARWTRALAARGVTRAELTDDHLTEIVAANLGCSPEHRTEALEMALEIQQSRAKLAAIATFIEDLRKPNPENTWARNFVGPFIAQEIENRLNAAERST